MIARYSKHTIGAVLLSLGLLLSFFSFVPLKTRADTVIGGVITSDTVWTSSGNPYWMVDSVFVPSGVNLTIEEGVVISVDGYWSIQVEGTLTINGTESSPVIITSNVSAPSDDDWVGVVVPPGGHLFMNHANISYAYSAVFLKSSGNYISNSTFYASVYGLWVDESSNNTVVNCRALYNSREGFRIDEGEDNLLEGVVASYNVFAGLYLTLANNNTIQDGLFNANYWEGVWIHNSNGNWILNNTITDTTMYQGIRLEGSNGNHIIGNSAMFNHNNGIYMYQSTQNELIGNNFSGNHYYHGISMDESSSNHIEGNLLESNYYMGIGFWWSHNNTVVNNTARMNGNNGAYLYSSTGNLFEGNNFSNNIGYHGISIDETSDNTTVIGNLLAENGRYGVFAYYSSNHSIVGNRIETNSWNGVRFIEVDGASILNNTFVDGGITASGVENTVSGNTINGTTSWAMAFFDSENVTISQNDINVTDDGIYVQDSLYTLIEKNRIRAGNRGVTLSSFTNWSTIVYNTIYESGIGAAIALDATNNTVHHNNFINNTLQAWDETAENRWDDGYPSGGNYWSNYEGMDLCSGPNQDICPDSDGIGDTPYDLDADSRDNYPLTDPVDILAPPNTPPVASFTVVPLVGNVSTLFQFNASSSWDLEDSTDMLKVRWDFDGDGLWDTLFSTNKTITHQYSALGNYSVVMEVRDTGRLLDATTTNVSVENTPPVASFSVTPMMGNLSTLFEFNATSSADLEDPPTLLEFRWDWETDGVWDTVWSVSGIATHQYSSPGTFMVSLEVRDSGGLTNRTSREVTVQNTPPLASFEVTPETGNITTFFSVDSSFSSDLEDPLEILEVRWDWENDGIWDTSWSSEKTATHQYTAPGDYTIRLEVKDSQGLTNSTTRLVVVENLPPEASFNITPTSGDILTTFVLNATSSSDLEDSMVLLEVRWDFENDGIWDTSWSTNKTVQHQYTNPGTYTIRLEVRDTGGLTNTTTREVVVNPDLIPPAPPTDLHVETTEERGALLITWNSSASPDVHIYRIYRSDAEEGDYVLVEEVDSTVHSFTDTDLEDDKTYWYYVTAVDEAGNESDPSDKESARTGKGSTTFDIWPWLILLVILVFVALFLILLILRRRRRTAGVTETEELEEKGDDHAPES